MTITLTMRMIVAAFLLCHSLKLGLNCYEMATIFMGIYHYYYYSCYTIITIILLLRILLKHNTALLSICMYVRLRHDISTFLKYLIV